MHHSNNHALLIGIGQRDDDRSEKIKVTATDASRLATEFQNRCGYNGNNVTPLVAEQALTRKVLRQLDTLIEKTKATPANLVVIFFSGHGFRKDGQFFFINRDTEFDDLEYTAIKGSDFIGKVNQINAKSVLILLNCCHSGAVLADGCESTEIPFDKTEFLNKPNRAIITACDSAEKAFTSTPLSVFTYALLSGLAGECIKNNGKKEVTLFDLAMYIREMVVGYSKNKQHPRLEVLKNTSTTNFEIVNYSDGVPSFTKEERGGLYDALGVELKAPYIVEDKDYREQFQWLVNPKNMAIGSTLEAGETVKIGDDIETDGSIDLPKQEGAKNLLIDSNVKAKNIFVGDTIKIQSVANRSLSISNKHKRFSEKNTISESEIKADNFRLGDDVVSGNQNVHIVHHHYNNQKAAENTPPQYSSLKTQLQQLIKKEEIEAALELFMDEAEKQGLDCFDELLLLSARFNRAKRSERKGTDNPQAEHNRINDALLSLIKDLE